jgi:hypothetical protein
MAEDTQQNEMVTESVQVTEDMVLEFVKEIIKLEQDNLYVNRANLKEQIVAIAKTKVR